MKQTRKQMSDAVSHLGWRYVLGAVRTTIPVDSIAQAAEVATFVATGDVTIDLRPDKLLVATKDVELAAYITTVVRDEGFDTFPGQVQALELAIDAIDIAAIRPFWKAVLDYQEDDDGALSDPRGQGPVLWFQQMDAPRPQRNRIHFDISVPHDESSERIAAALKAGGTLLSDEAAPRFWVLSDVEGNEICVCSWEGRD